MIYSLPNGKTINISIEDYLNLTDEDIQYMVAYNQGMLIVSPFYGSSINNKVKHTVIDITELIDDTSDDFNIPKSLLTIDEVIMEEIVIENHCPNDED